MEEGANARHTQGFGHDPIVMQSFRMCYQQGKNTTKMQLGMMALEARYQMAWWAKLVARGQGLAWEMIQNYPGRNYDPPSLGKVQEGVQRGGSEE